MSVGKIISKDLPSPARRSDSVLQCATVSSFRSSSDARGEHHHHGHDEVGDERRVREHERERSTEGEELHDIHSRSPGREAGSLQSFRMASSAR